MWMGIIQFIENPDKTKRRRKGKYALCFRWDMHLLLLLEIGTPGSWVFRLRLELTPLAPVVLKPSGLGWNCTTSFPGLPASRQQIIGLLNLQNYVHQPLSIYFYMSYWFCFCEEPFVIQLGSLVLSHLALFLFSHSTIGSG